MLWTFLTVLIENHCFRECTRTADSGDNKQSKFASCTWKHKNHISCSGSPTGHVGCIPSGWKSTFAFTWIVLPLCYICYMLQPTRQRFLLWRTSLFSANLSFLACCAAMLRAQLSICVTEKQGWVGFKVTELKVVYKQNGKMHLSWTDDQNYKMYSFIFSTIIRLCWNTGQEKSAAIKHRLSCCIAMQCDTEDKHCTHTACRKTPINTQSS